MATDAQITANRANAQKSTGPRSAEGRAASRFNALKHGMDAQTAVLPNEDPAEYETLVRDYRNGFHPANPEEHFHVDTMLRADWQIRRLQCVEADLYRTLLAESPGATLAAAMLSGSPAAKLLARIQRQLTAFERAWYRALKELHSARERAAAAEEQARDVSPEHPGPSLNRLRSRKTGSSASPLPPYGSDPHNEPSCVSNKVAPIHTDSRR